MSKINHQYRNRVANIKRTENIEKRLEGWADFILADAAKKEKFERNLRRKGRKQRRA